MQKTYLTYGAASLFILSWWSLAATWRTAATTLPATQQAMTETAAPTLPVTLQLTPWTRDDLIHALAGDISTAARLLAAWDLDAELLQHSGLPGIQRLPRPQLLKAVSLAHQLLQSTETQSQYLHRDGRPSMVYDSHATAFSLDRSYPRTLPQTYAAASYLLALESPASIAALPAGIRQQQHLFPKTPFSTIPHDCDSYQTELLQISPPSLAFTAPYSQPAFLAALANQGIANFILDAPTSLNQIGHTFRTIGYIVDRTPEAEVLASLWESSFLALDNLMIAHRHTTPSPKRPLFLFHYQGHNYLPAHQTLTAQMLERLSLLPSDSLAAPSDPWLIPLTLEQIVAYNPDCLITATEDLTTWHQQLHQAPINATSAYQLGRCYHVEATVQESITQHTALAYFDLCHVFLNTL